MPAKNEFEIKDLISIFLKRNNLKGAVLSKEAENAWYKITGDLIVKLTLKVMVKDAVMYVYLASPALKQELSFKHDELVKRINDYVSEKAIRKIVFR